MKETPLLMKDFLVVLALENVKTETRRLQGLEWLNEHPYYKNRINKVECRKGLWHFWEEGHGSSALPVFTAKCPYGLAGDRLWIRETWRVNKSYDVLKASLVYVAMGGDVAYCIDYAADPRKDATEIWGGKWRPSIFMPKWACRLKLEIIEIRAERLQHLTMEGAYAEGTPVTWGDWRGKAPAWAVKSIGPKHGSPGTHIWDNRTTIKNFSLLWDSINAKNGNGWDSNPWVWVITFKKTK